MGRDDWGGSRRGPCGASGSRAQEVNRPGKWDADSVGAHRNSVRSRRPGGQPSLPLYGLMRSLPHVDEGRVALTLRKVAPAGCEPARYVGLETLKQHFRALVAQGHITPHCGCRGSWCE